MRTHKAFRNVFAFAAILAMGAAGAYAQRTVKADVVALDQAFYNNRLGTFQAGGMIFALRRDVVTNDSSVGPLTKGNVMLRPDKRPRPLVLRLNVGDCMEIEFQNLLADLPSVGEVGPFPFDPKVFKRVDDPSAAESSLAQPATRAAGVHVMGMELKELASDGSWIGANASSLANPGESKTYRFCPVAEGSYLLYSTGADLGVGDQFGNSFGGQLTQGLFGAVTVQPKNAEWYRSQVTRVDLDLATVQANQLPAGMSLAPKMSGGKQETFIADGKTYKVSILTAQNGPNVAKTEVTQVNLAGDPVDRNGLVKTRDLHPIIDYRAVYPPGSRFAGAPILAMLNGQAEIVHGDLTAIITGPGAGSFPKNDADPVFLPNPTSPDRHQPYREFAIHYHDDGAVTQAFPEFRSTQPPDCDPAKTCGVTFALEAARDFFAINYGMGAIGPEVWANRIKVGPMHQCDTCKFEEFFLSAWAVGDPAMVVDVPANATTATGPKATKALYPDDPSNVYHSYMGDHVQFRILHAGTNITHVHHQHAHQWLHSPNSDDSDYRDSQMISPGGAYTLDMSYFGSGNLNQTVGDSIFHCHFYPHFAQGMWAMWRVHDVFEAGTLLDSDQKPVLDWNRALPDGEIPQGTPIPAIVPLPTLAMASIPVRTKLCKVWEAADYVQFTGEVCPAKPPGSGSEVGIKALVSKLDITTKKEKNPGYPFFVPGIAGQRAPHPPMDFAPEEDANGKQKVIAGVKQYLDGGLPRNLVLKDQGTIYEQHNAWDFTKENDSLVAVQLPEEGTSVETVAMAAHAVRKHPSVTPSGLPADFVLNGQPPKPGAPFADPAVDVQGKPVRDSDCRQAQHPGCVQYKAADIQMDVVLNKKGWHFPQQRMLSLWGDVKGNLDGKRRPEPLFFRANSEKVVEYWHTNLVPANYELDDFQVRTPTDILGQHIHLVKFDVTSSDGAGNGFNYEDGTLSPEEVTGLIGQINKNNGLFSTDATHRRLLKPKEIPYFAKVFPNKWPGAQTTVQRWYADPIYNCKKPIVLTVAPPISCAPAEDRTLRTVFTHDHFGPSTHQQVGLYAGLVVEPKGSKWFDSSTGEELGKRTADPDGNPLKDGGPTTFQANIALPDASKSYREFLLEFQDRQLAYLSTSISTPKPYVKYGPGLPVQNPSGPWGWADPANAINPPAGPLDPVIRPGGGPTPYLVTNSFAEGTYSLNYSNEPLAYRLLPGTKPEQSDLAHVFRSIKRADPPMNVQPSAGQPIDPASLFKFPPPPAGAADEDPYTPLLRAYEGDNIQIRNLVGAHMGPHAFTIHGLKWQFEPSLKSSGFRGTQGMSLSEHYELLFHLPVTSLPKSADYLYIPTSDANGLQYGNWGLLRGFKDKQPKLIPLSESQAKAFPGGGQIPPAGGPAATCPANAPLRKFQVTAIMARDALNGPLVYNARGTVNTMGQQPILDWNALMYVQSADLVNGKLKNAAPREPLILRAAAGDCIELELTNALPQAGTPLNPGIEADPGLTGVSLTTSHNVGLHAQLVSYDIGKSNGVNIGFNPDTTTPPCAPQTNCTPGKYQWYAGKIDRDALGKPVYTAMEYGAISLTPADPLMQHNFGLVGGLIVEPQGSTWVTDDNSRASATVTNADNSSFRESVLLVHDDLASLATNDPITISATDGAPPSWTLNGSAQPNNSTYSIQAGPTVGFYSQSGTHGVVFSSKADAERYFDFGTSAVLFGPQPWCPTSGPCVPNGGWGTAAAAPSGGSPYLLATLQVRMDIPAGTPPLPFQDPATGAQMSGAFVLAAGLPSAGFADTTRALNYRTEPFSYRYLNPDYLQNQPGLSPLGSSRSQSNSLVAADPQTPVFAAEAGKPLRLRLLHPAGLNEQVFTLHGHAWQEEPYSPDSTKMTSNNPLSQWTGSRDTFGPNSSLDIVLNKAGGNSSVQGDYLFRTFMGDDFLFGMWGLLRVGPPGKDVVTVTQFCAPNPPVVPVFTVAGMNTVNPSNHHMATNVTITGTGLSIPPVPVDPMTGRWLFQSAILSPPPSIAVQSNQGGQASVTAQICPIQGNPAAAPVPLTQPLPTVTLLTRRNDRRPATNQVRKANPKAVSNELNRFKPKAATVTQTNTKTLR